MEHSERNGYIISKILDEIAEIDSFTAGITENGFMNNTMCQKAVVMSLINIGELSKALTESYTAAVPEIPWRDIRGFRNIAAHHYGKIDMLDVWKTVREDIPALDAALKRRLSKQ